ncbi:hypothetical protein H5410_060962 [Solanum commersonii]|uniref:Uncharacterized protein n=1 Tax=Solanum commersonii TaxID=4109 RepID=A0A9J5W7J8_SOLCO|nr:hypothetical protein H5410_060962 [Solanum commersonii]
MIAKTIQDYKSIPNKGIIADTSVRHMARKISYQDGDDQNEMINNYLEGVKINLLLNITHHTRSNSSMRSETKLKENLHDKVYSFLYTFGSESDYDDDDYSESGSEIDKPETSGNTQSTTIDSCKCRGDICSCEHDEFYKLQSQFEDLNMKTITSDNVIELVKEVTDNTLREKIIQLAANNKASSSNIIERSKNEFKYSAPYSLSEVNNRLYKQHVVIRDTSFDDLKGEIEQLNQEIKYLKQTQIICDHRLTHIESLKEKILLKKKLFKNLLILILNKICFQITPIQTSIDFASKFPDVITDRTQLQRFLGSLNYIFPFYKNLSRDLVPLYGRLNKDHKEPWTGSLTNLVKNIKLRVKFVPCLILANPVWQKIVETYTSNIRYGGI